MANHDRVLIGAQSIMVWQLELGPSFHVVRKCLVDDGKAECDEFSFQPRQPDIISRAAAIAVDQNDLCVGVGHVVNRILTELYGVRNRSIRHVYVPW